MESASNAKRGAPTEISDAEGSSGSSHKRCRQQDPRTRKHYVWPSRQSKELQSSSLQRVQSPPIGAESQKEAICSDLEHWRSREAERRPCHDRMAVVQPEVTVTMRTTLVDWLGEVRDEFRLHSETLFLAVSYLDSFLALKPVSRGRFQLLGLACVWVAAKFEEVVTPPLSAMLAMAENAYSAEDMTAMEREVLFTLDFGMAVPTSLRFLHHLLRLAPLPASPSEATSARRLAESLLELTLLDCGFLSALPSQLAAAAIYLALGLLQHSERLGEVAALSKMEPGALGLLVKRLYKILQDATAQPHPCALLLRFKAWERLHGGAGIGGRRAAAVNVVPAVTVAAAVKAFVMPPSDACRTPPPGAAARGGGGAAAATRIPPAAATAAAVTAAAATPSNPVVVATAAAAAADSLGSHPDMGTPSDLLPSYPFSAPPGSELPPPRGAQLYLQQQQLSSGQHLQEPEAAATAAAAMAVPAMTAMGRMSLPRPEYAPPRPCRPDHADVPSAEWSARPRPFPALSHVNQPPTPTPPLPLQQQPLPPLQQQPLQPLQPLQQQRLEFRRPQVRKHGMTARGGRGSPKPQIRKPEAAAVATAAAAATAEAAAATAAASVDGGCSSWGGSTSPTPSLGLTALDSLKLLSSIDTTTTTTSTGTVTATTTAEEVGATAEGDTRD